MDKKITDFEKRLKKITSIDGVTVIDANEISRTELVLFVIDALREINDKKKDK